MSNFVIYHLICQAVFCQDCYIAIAYIGCPNIFSVSTGYSYKQPICISMVHLSIHTYFVGTLWEKLYRKVLINFCIAEHACKDVLLSFSCSQKIQFQLFLRKINIPGLHIYTRQQKKCKDFCKVCIIKYNSYSYTDSMLNVCTIQCTVTTAMQHVATYYSCSLLQKYNMSLYFN